MRIYIFGFKETQTNKQTKIPLANLFVQIFFFPLQTIEDRALCKLGLKNSIKLIIFFCGRPSEDCFRHPHFRKQEYYFFFAKIGNI